MEKAMKIKKVTYTIECLIVCKPGESAIDLFNAERVRILQEMAGDQQHESFDVDDLIMGKNWDDDGHVPYGRNDYERPLISILMEEK